MYSGARMLIFLLQLTNPQSPAMVNGKIKIGWPHDHGAVSIFCLLF